MPVIARILEDALHGRDPDPMACEDVLDAVMRGEVNDAAIGGFLVALRARPPRADLLAALARSLRRHRRAVTPRVRPLIDTCGTGGDGAGTFNISTAAALVVAACGGAVAKHGNRSVSSKSGSADVLEACGLTLSVPPDAAARMIDACGFAFLFAPLYHPAMRHVMPARRALGIRTHFNLLGPLCNPAAAEYQVLGVASPDLTSPMAEALRRLGSRGALVIHCDGLDEFGLHAPTVGHRVTPEGIAPFRLDPRSLGLPQAPLSALAGGDAPTNARILRAVLDGQGGPPADCVALNAAAALFTSGLVRDLGEGLEAARAALDDGAAARVLERAVASSGRLSSQRSRDPATTPASSGAGSFLDSLRASVEGQAAALPPAPPPAAGRPSLVDALAGRASLSVIAEMKRRSPSRGSLASEGSPHRRVRLYTRGGAAAISVLTQASHFGGSLQDLRDVRRATPLPLLMKDFIRDDRQLAHGAALGASGALLIVRWLEDALLSHLLRACQELGLDALVECHDARDVDRALTAGATLIGLNNRNLETLRVEPGTVERLLPALPEDTVVVAESGYAAPEDIHPLQGRVDAVLVGTALMTAAAPDSFLREVVR